ncbi:hypothetical protein ACRDNQ_13050 [Palleronia sp. KMU-117]|uniref:hypothetical protein n=1 Tax=Palleronia sp. KMU-117 TaxID=3434108 RepID=UPI003D742BC1
MIEVLAALEATGLAQHLKASRWTYPLVNAGHVLGIALLVGAVIPMDVAILRGRAASAQALLRPFAVAGFVLTLACGALLFVTQAGDYIANGWFQAKMALLGAAIVNAALHLRASGRGLRRAAIASLVLWPGVLLAGRMIAYS